MPNNGGHFVFLVDLITTPFLKDLQWSPVYRAGYRLVASERLPTQVTSLLFYSMPGNICGHFNFAIFTVECHHGK